MSAKPATSSGRGSRISRIGIAAALLTATALVFSGSAAGREPLEDLDTRVGSTQGDLDATTLKVEQLRDEGNHLTSEIAEIEARTEQLEREREGLVDDAVSRAGQHPGAFVPLVRAEAELELLNERLMERREELEHNRELLVREKKRLQTQFREVASEYQTLRRNLAQAQTEPADVSSAGGSEPPLKVEVTGDMTCPVAGPVSFTDTWGAPRSGHTHQGVDMMGDYGTPLVAIVSGTPSYVAYDGSGGNMIFLDGDDGNSYWYMHNQENLVSVGQHVEVGEQIGTLGDTGNAAGTPHVHFEYHPGGGEPINPYPLVASLC